MKIGILTVPFNNNYGGFLQAYALKKALTDMGHDVVFINRRRNRKQGVKAALRRVLVSCRLLKDRTAEKQAEISVYTNQFRSKYLEPVTRDYYTTKELRKSLKMGIDCFVVGSDQVWRYRYAKDSIDDFFFSFLKGTAIPRFSYAASVGTDEMEYSEDKLAICKALLADFSAVSVRETSAAEMLATHFGCHRAKVVLDPTLLHDKQVYIDLFKDTYPKSDKKYMFTYILDETEDKRENIGKIARAKNLDVMDVKAQKGNLSSQRTIEPVEKWLSGICYSDFVVTDSFHGIVFSIIFGRPFVAIGNEQRGLTRMSDLLSRLHLEHRLVASSADVEKVIDQPICWQSVSDAILSERQQSLSFLNEALSI